MRQNFRSNKNGKTNSNSKSNKFSSNRVSSSNLNATTRSPQVQLFPKGLRTVVGTHAIREALNINLNFVEILWLEEGWESNQDLKKLHTDFFKKIKKIEVKPSSILDRISGSHQGAAVFLNITPQVDWLKVYEKNKSQIVVLDRIEDPHNLGAVLRSSWLMGVDAIIIPSDHSVGLTATVHKIACGGVEHVPVVTLNNFNNLLEELKKNGYWIYGLSHKSKSSIFDLKLPNKVVWCVGAEEKGLRTTTEKSCDELVFIPQASAAASYNASVASGMALLETHRQHNKLAN